jgi:hypothetical protein
MCLAVDGVTEHVGGVHDRFGPTSDTSAELKLFIWGLNQLILPSK